MATLRVSGIGSAGGEVRPRIPHRGAAKTRGRAFVSARPASLVPLVGRLLAVPGVLVADREGVLGAAIVGLHARLHLTGGVQRDAGSLARVLARVLGGLLGRLLLALHRLLEGLPLLFVHAPRVSPSQESATRGRCG